jgi:hypothetical protein
VWWAWLQNWIWVPVVSLYLIFIPLLLPEGHLLSAGWRCIAWFAALATAFLSFFFATQPGPLANFWPVLNPLGAMATPGWWPAMVRLGFGLMVLAMIASVSSLVLRLRRAGQVERQQLKWVAFACTWGAAGMLASLVFGLYTLPSVLLILGGIFGMHTATAIAILRYRLYDIDVILRRTLIYGLLTAALAAIYFACVVALQTVAMRVTGQQRSELVAILSTLAMAFLASPLRARLQQSIDRRFYRRKYDAAQSLARFGQTVRNAAPADLNQLSDEILAVVDETLQPASAILWIRPHGGNKIR